MKNVKEFARSLASVNPKLAALLEEAIARDEPNTARGYTAIQAAKSDIEHSCDGPITPFVLISRACASVGAHDSTTVANALTEALEVRGWLRDGLEETDS